MPNNNDLKFSPEEFIDWAVLALSNGKEYYFPKNDMAMWQKRLNDASVRYIEFTGLMGASKTDPKNRTILEYSEESPKTINKDFVMMLEDMHYSHSVMLNVPTGLQILLQIRVRDFFEQIKKAPTKDELIGIAIAMMEEVKKSAEEAEKKNDQSSLEEKIEEAENKDTPNQTPDENNNLKDQSNEGEESKTT